MASPVTISTSLDHVCLRICNLPDPKFGIIYGSYRLNPSSPTQNLMGIFIDGVVPIGEQATLAAMIVNVKKAIQQKTAKASITDSVLTLTTNLPSKPDEKKAT